MTKKQKKLIDYFSLEKNYSYLLTKKMIKPLELIYI